MSLASKSTGSCVTKSSWRRSYRRSALTLRRPCPIPRVKEPRLVGGIARVKKLLLTLIKKVEQIEQELAQTREQADSASKRYEEVSEAKNELESRLQAEKEDNQILKQKYEALATKNQSLQSRAAQTDSHSPGHKEQMENVQRHFRQELSIRDNEIKKLQRKLRDGAERQSRLSLEIAQLKNRPTLPQSPVTDMATSSGLADSSLAALSSFSEGHIQSLRPMNQSRSASPQSTDSNTVSSAPPISLDKPKTLTELAETPTSPQSSQSSLHESQLLRPLGLGKGSVAMHILTATRDKTPQQESGGEQGNSQSQGLRRSTRRSVSVSGASNSAAEDGTDLADRTKKSSNVKRARRS
ncbi:hypothetical protein P389DRAFT_50370 [Cystobasidium minutum MCA 4210]|uniref:uncharacterized protein n=1 Tax=Cystobasidium minutum MCA 4210 TaxID=1397322 RepID=UPI0034CEB25C|eukprot:jgi/Rhomi1/50370/CE50369_605